MNIEKWPSCTWEVRPWKQKSRAGSREDRTLSEIEVCVPPVIGNLRMSLDQELLAVLDDAAREVTALEASSAGTLKALGALLLRTESVASSKIENIEASIDDYARAVYGSKQNESALAMVAGTRGIEKFMGEVEKDSRVTQSSLKLAQQHVVATDEKEKLSAGKYREVQNWIDGSDYSPRGAIFIPPPPELVPVLMDDLERFVNRSDLNIVFQATVSHAQFETIHPFTDGNGRVGRALINGIFRQRGLTHNIVIPLASSIVANKERYFSQLTAYRVGDPYPLIREFALGTKVAAQEAKDSAQKLLEIPELWRSKISRLRKGSATDLILTSLLSAPVVTAEDLILKNGFAVNSVYSALERLLEAEVIRPLTKRKRNQVWGASAVLDELDDLSLRIRVRSK